MVELTEKQKEARKKVCLPLDGLKTIEEIRSMVEELSPVVGLFKIGFETFTRFGPEAVKLVQSYGSEVFLDLKYHDIPNTVKGASKAAAELGVEIFNIHCSGGLSMMKAAIEGINEAKTEKKTKVIGVTVLTSLDDEDLKSINISKAMDEQVLDLAKLAKDAGLDGIVCSAADVKDIKGKFPKDFMFITPGVKGPKTYAGADQKRVNTPGNAIEDGSTILVIGRAITGAEDRLKAGLEILEDIEKKI